MTNMSLVEEAQLMDLPATFLIDCLGSSVGNSFVNAFKLYINNNSSSFIEALQANDNGVQPPSIPNNVLEDFNSALANSFE